MKKSIVAIIAVMLLAGSVPASAVQIDVNIGGPSQTPTVVIPAPAPQVMMPAPAPQVMVAPAAPMIQYQYYPAYNIYYDPGNRQYWSMNGGRWTPGPLPGNIRPERLGAPQIVSAPNNPWEHRGDHRMQPQQPMGHQHMERQQQRDMHNNQMHDHRGDHHGRHHGDRQDGHQGNRQDDHQRGF